MKSLITLSALLAITACNGIGPKNSSEFASLSAIQGNASAESEAAPMADPTVSDKDPVQQNTVIPGDQISVTPGDQISVTPGDQTSVTPGDQTSVTPGDQTSVTPGDQTSVTPGDQTSVTPGDQTSVTPGDQTSVTPGDQAADLGEPIVQIVDQPVACTAPETGAGSGYGLFAKVYDANGFGNNNTRDQVFSKGVLLDKEAYLPKLNFIAEQLKDAEGNAIKGLSQADLKNNYGLLMETQIVLRAEDQEGMYQFAALSNDSLEVSVIDGPGFIKSPPSNTRNKLNCALSQGNQLIQVEMKHGKALKLRIRFTKVSKDDVALVMVMRRVKALDGAQLIDPAEKSCNSANPNKDVMSEMFARSWKLLDHKNFISQDAPCDRAAGLEAIVLK